MLQLKEEYEGNFIKMCIDIEFSDEKYCWLMTEKMFGMGKNGVDVAISGRCTEYYEDKDLCKKWMVREA